jgi:hypothetical protein
MAGFVNSTPDALSFFVQVGESFPGLGHFQKMHAILRLPLLRQRAAFLSTFSVIDHSAPYNYVTACAFRFLRQPSGTNQIVSAEASQQQARWQRQGMQTQ